jgi:ribosome maturation factor RimP
LRTAREYMQAIGQYVYVEIRHPLNGQSTWEGWLDQYEEETVILRLQKSKKLLRIPKEDITFARRSVYFG